MDFWLNDWKIQQLRTRSPKAGSFRSNSSSAIYSLLTLFNLINISFPQFFFKLKKKTKNCFLYHIVAFVNGLPGSSVGKESACNSGDPSSIHGLGRSAGEGIGYPLQDSWVSLVAQLVKNLSAMRETWVQSLGWEDPLEKGKATHSSILAWRIP